MSKPQNYPPFCPAHQGNKGVKVCYRPISCEECRRRFVDANIDPKEHQQ